MLFCDHQVLTPPLLVEVKYQQPPRLVGGGDQSSRETEQVAVTIVPGGVGQVDDKVHLAQRLCGQFRAGLG